MLSEDSFYNMCDQNKLQTIETRHKITIFISMIKLECLDRLYINGRGIL